MVWVQQIREWTLPVGTTVIIWRVDILVVSFSRLTKLIFTFIFVFAFFLFVYVPTISDPLRPCQENCPETPRSRCCLLGGSSQAGNGPITFLSSLTWKWFPVWGRSCCRESFLSSQGRSSVAITLFFPECAVVLRFADLSLFCFLLLDFLLVAEKLTLKIDIVFVSRSLSIDCVLVSLSFKPCSSEMIFSSNLIMWRLTAGFYSSSGMDAWMIAWKSFSRSFQLFLICEVAIEVAINLLINSINWPASSVWVFVADRALQRERRGHGFESRWSPEKLFFGLLRNCLNCDSTTMVTSKTTTKYPG